MNLLGEFFSKFIIEIAVYILLINVITATLYLADKIKAKKNKWRIPEATLIGFAFAGGSLGAFLAMKIFRHKTRHAKFFITVPVLLILHIALLGLLIFSYISL